MRDRTILIEQHTTDAIAPSEDESGNRSIKRIPRGKLLPREPHMSEALVIKTGRLLTIVWSIRVIAEREARSML